MGGRHSRRGSPRNPRLFAPGQGALGSSGIQGTGRPGTTPNRSAVSRLRATRRLDSASAPTVSTNNRRDYTLLTAWSRSRTPVRRLVPPRAARTRRLSAFGRSARAGRQIPLRRGLLQVWQPGVRSWTVSWAYVIGPPGLAEMQKLQSGTAKCWNSSYSATALASLAGRRDECVRHIIGAA